MKESTMNIVTQKIYIIPSYNMLKKRKEKELACLNLFTF